MTHEWLPFTDDYDYDKRPYRIRTPDGDECVCWPNAGTMNSMDGSGRMWDGSAGVECRFAYPDDDAMGMRDMEERRMREERAPEPPPSPRKVPRALLASMAAMGAEWVYMPGRERAECTHRYGLAGGFSECSACGVRASRRKE